MFAHHPAVVQLDGLHQPGVAAGEVLYVVELGEQLVEGAGLEHGVQHSGVAVFVGEHEVVGELLLRDAQLVLVEAQRGAVGLGLPLQRLQVQGGDGVGAYRLVETAVKRGDPRSGLARLRPFGAEGARLRDRRHAEKEKGRQERTDEDDSETCAHDHRMTPRSVDRQ